MVSSTDWKSSLGVLGAQNNNYRVEMNDAKTATAKLVPLPALKARTHHLRRFPKYYILQSGLSLIYYF